MFAGAFHTPAPAATATAGSAAGGQSSTATHLSKVVSPAPLPISMWTQPTMHPHATTATATQSVGLTTTSQSNLQAMHQQQQQQQQQQAQLQHQQQQQHSHPLFAQSTGPGQLSPNGSAMHPSYMSALSMQHGQMQLPMQPSHPIMNSTSQFQHPSNPQQHQQQQQQQQQQQFAQEQHAAQLQAQLRFQHQQQLIQQQVAQQQQLQQAHAAAMAQAQAQHQAAAAAAAAASQMMHQPSPAFHLSLLVHGSPDLPYPSYFDPSSQAPDAHPLLCSTCQHPIPRGDVMIATVCLSYGNAAASTGAVKTDPAQSSSSPTFFRHLECAHPSHLLAFGDHFNLIPGYYALNSHQQMVVEQRLQYARGVGVGGGGAGMGMNIAAARPTMPPPQAAMGMHSSLHSHSMLPTMPPQLVGGHPETARSPSLHPVMASALTPQYHRAAQQQKQQQHQSKPHSRSTPHTPARAVTASRTHTAAAHSHSTVPAATTTVALTATGRPQRSTSKKARHGDFKYSSDHSASEEHEHEEGEAGEGAEGGGAGSHTGGSQGSHDDGRSSDPDVEPEEEDEEDEDEEEEEEYGDDADDYDEEHRSRRRAGTTQAARSHRRSTSHSRTPAAPARSGSSTGPHARSPGASSSSAQAAGQKRKRTRKDPNAPKRPASNYMFWCRSRRPQLKAEFPEVNSNILMQKLAVEWRAMDFTSPAGKRALAQWDALHLKDQRRYQRQMKEWKEKGEYTEVPEADAGAEDEEHEDHESRHHTAIIDVASAPASASASVAGDEPTPALPRIVSNQSTSTSASTSTGSSAVGPASSSSSSHSSSSRASIAAAAAAAVASATAAAAAASAADPSAILMEDGSPGALESFRRIQSAERRHLAVPKASSMAAMHSTLLPAAALQVTQQPKRSAVAPSTVAAAAAVPAGVAPSKPVSTPISHSLADLLVGMSEIA